jgi:hypothetical protein
MDWLSLHSFAVFDGVGIVAGITAMAIGFTIQRKRRAGAGPPFLTGWGFMAPVLILAIACFFVGLAVAFQHRH